MGRNGGVKVTVKGRDIYMEKKQGRVCDLEMLLSKVTKGFVRVRSRMGGARMCRGKGNEQGLGFTY